ncbi:MAG: hypothetical protein ABID35_00885 [Candidatus Margulisiibacteriota bacterium]
MPVYTPVYNVQRNILEATLNANQGASREVVAEEIFHALQTSGFFPPEALYEDYESDLIGIIEDRDNDGYFDVSLSDLNAVFSADFTQSPDNADLRESIQNMPLFETYFQDTVSLSMPTVQPAQSGNPALASMTFSEAQSYFRTTYSKGSWDEARLNQFRNDVQTFMDSHFTATPVQSVGEAADAVNDNLPTVSDDLFAQMSRDPQGRVRVDCGVYASIYQSIFKAAKMETGFAYVVVQMPDNSIGGHVVAYGMRGSDIVLGNNATVETLQNGNAVSLRALIDETSRGMGQILSTNFASSIAEANKLANSKLGVVLRYFNSANNSVLNNLKVILTLSLNTDELAQNLPQDILNTHRTDTSQLIDTAIADMQHMIDNVDNSSSFEFMGIQLEGQEEIRAFGRHFIAVLAAAKKSINGQPLSTQETSRLQAAQTYFCQFNTEDASYGICVLATQLFSAE